MIDFQKLSPLNNVLLIAVGLLIVGQVYLFWSRPSVSATPAPVAPGQSGDNTSAQTVPSNILTPVRGTVQGVENGVVQLAVGAETRFIAVGTDTSVVLQGDMKDAETRRAEEERFKKNSVAMAVDAEENGATLQRLIAPSMYKETGISVRDVRIGDTVLAYVDGQSEGVYAAVRVVVMRNQ